MMRWLLIGGTLAALVVALAACGGSSTSGSAQQELQRKADLYSIDEIEKIWHHAASTHDLDLMMSIWAPDARFTFGGQTFTGKPAIREVLSKAGPFQPQNHWVSDTPAYKIRTTVSGDKGTIYFECHYIDVKTSMVVAVVGADQDVEKIDGKWLITNAVAATPTLQP
jgi:ketosteroid isomerase-like protein